MIALAALAAFAAVWLLVVPGGAGLSRRREAPPQRAASEASWAVLAPMAGIALVVSAGVVGGARAAVVAAALVMVGGSALLVVTRVRVRVRRAAERAEVAWAGEVLSGLLRAGHVPSTALAAAASETAVLRPAADLQRVGGSVPAALRRTADHPGREGLAELAAAWAVAERTGASLGDAVAATAEQLAGRQAVARTVAAELASPRATGRVMATLPVAGLVLGFGFGGNPLAFLLDAAPGWACLLGGVGLGCAGVLWTEALADRAAGD